MIKRNQNNSDGKPFMMNPILEEMKVKRALNQRKIMLMEEFDRESCFMVEYYMDKIKENDDLLGEPIESRKPITIEIKSYGGGCYDCFSLIGKIKQFQELGYKVNTETSSFGMSCGFMLAIVGSNRSIGRYGCLMLHQVSSFCYGTLQGMEEDMEETKRVWNILKRIIIEHTNYTEEMLDEIKRTKQDIYLSPEDAVAMGCIDNIL